MEVPKNQLLCLLSLFYALGNAKLHVQFLTLLMNGRPWTRVTMIEGSKCLRVAWDFWDGLIFNKTISCVTMGFNIPINRQFIIQIEKWLRFLHIHVWMLLSGPYGRFVVLKDACISIGRGPLTLHSMHHFLTPFHTKIHVNNFEKQYV